MESAESRRFREFLQGEGLKFTTERQLILDEVFSIHSHFEAEDVVMGLRDKGQRVSLASVYRTLPLLVGSGLLRDVHSAEKHSHYEHIFGHEHHDHLICTSCGATIEVVNPAIERLQEEMCEMYGFQARAHRLEITGLCAKCSAKRKD